MAAIDRTNVTMQAAVFHGQERITIERVRIPDVGKGEVLVRVSRTALCGSDFKLWHKGAEFTAGHEIFGVVEQPGHRMHGRRCAVYIPVHCDRCAACRRGDTQMCLEISSLIGWNRPGGYAEYLPVPENCLLPVPDDIEDSLAPLLLDTIGTSAHAVRFVSRVVPPEKPDPFSSPAPDRSGSASFSHSGMPATAIFTFPIPMSGGSGSHRRLARNRTPWATPASALR